MKDKHLSKRYRIDRPKDFRLADHDPADTAKLSGKKEAEEILAKGLVRLRELQERLYAEDRWSLLIVIQAMDAAGKDSTIEHVMSGVNPQGCQVHSFKQPSSEELDHDFLWRCAVRLPERGRIGIFNRSYYEEVLVVRVHPKILSMQRLPERVVTKGIWRERCEDIAGFERHLARSGTRILKFFLHVSPEEQRRRFLDRIEDQEKNWKFSAGDVAEREHWDEYQAAYEDAIRNTSAPDSPWYVVPADHKWFTRLVVMDAIVGELEGLELAYPKLDKAHAQALEVAALALESERGEGKHPSKRKG